MSLEYSDVMDLSFSVLKQRLERIPIAKIDPENRLVIEDALYFLSNEPERRLSSLGLPIQRTDEEKAQEAKQFYLYFRPYQKSVGYGRLTQWDLFKTLEFFGYVAGYTGTSIMDALKSEVNGEIENFSMKKKYFRSLILQKIKNRKLKEGETVDDGLQRINWNSAYRKFLTEKENFVRKLYRFEPKDALPIVIIAAERTGTFFERSALEEAKRFDISIEDLVRCYVASYSDPNQLISYWPDLPEEDNWQKHLPEEINIWRNIFRERILFAQSNFPLVEPTPKHIFSILPAYRFGIIKELSNSSVKAVNELLDELLKKGRIIRIEDGFGQGMYYAKLKAPVI